MTNWRMWYWPVFNVLVRALGLATLVSGTVFILWGTSRMLQLEYITMEGASAIAILPIGLLVALLGAAILRTPAYRPDQGDVLWQFDGVVAKTRRSSPSRRSWWTGDRVTSFRRAAA